MKCIDPILTVNSKVDVVNFQRGCSLWKHIISTDNCNEDYSWESCPHWQKRLGKSLICIEIGKYWNGWNRLFVFGDALVVLGTVRKELPYYSWEGAGKGLWELEIAVAER